ncbi:unnamed protein product, partial [Ixodes persulcatus]
LGLRTTLKTDIGCTAADLVYGQTLRLPAEMIAAPLISTMPDPLSYVTQLREVMRNLRATPTRHHDRHPTYVCEELTSATHVFVRRDAVKKPLDQPYDGPFKVLDRRDKFFLLDLNGRRDTISIDRLKPAHLDLNTA